jgi:hypothetical protein
LLVAFVANLWHNYLRLNENVELFLQEAHYVPDSTTQQRRHQLAAERLLDNSSLRDALDDDQAERLLDWGLAHVSRTAAATAHLPDEEAEATLDEVTTTVSRVMKEVNRLADDAAEMDESEARQRRQRLVDNLHRLQPGCAAAGLLAEGEEIMQRRQAVPSRELFENLMALLAGQDEEE